MEPLDVLRSDSQGLVSWPKGVEFCVAGASVVSSTARHYVITVRIFLTYYRDSESVVAVAENSVDEFVCFKLQSRISPCLVE